MSSLNLSKETYELASKLIDVEKELLELLASCNYNPSTLEVDRLKKYDNLMMRKEKIEEKIEQLLFLAIPNKKVVMERSQGRLKGIIRIYVACNSIVANSPQDHNKRLRTVALVRVRDDVDFKSEKKVAEKSFEEKEEKFFEETRPVAPTDKAKVEEEIEKLGFQRLPNSNYFFYVLAQEQ